jgi:hypothetical protein
MRVCDRDLIRGGHYGQRSCEPHQKAEHMAAPTNAAKREESPCQLGAVHTWHSVVIEDGVTVPVKTNLSRSKKTLPYWSAHLRADFQQDFIHSRYGYDCLLVACDRFGPFMIGH